MGWGGVGKTWLQPRWSWPLFPFPLHAGPRVPTLLFVMRKQRPFHREETRPPGQLAMAMECAEDTAQATHHGSSRNVRKDGCQGSMGRWKPQGELDLPSQPHPPPGALGGPN